MAIQVITPFIYCAIKIYGTVNKVLSSKLGVSLQPRSSLLSVCVFSNHKKMVLISKSIKFFQHIGIIIPRFSLFQKQSNFSNILEFSYRDSVYFRSSQIFPTYWNYHTEIQFISEAVKFFQHIGIIIPRFS